MIVIGVKRDIMSKIRELVNDASDEHPLKQAYLNNHRYYTDFMAVFEENLTKKNTETFLKNFSLIKNMIDKDTYK
jgi:hypothetical protein